MKEIIEILSRHVIPSYISSHREFALSLAMKVITVFPNDIDPFQVLSFASVMWDANTQVSVNAAKLIRLILNANPNQELIKEPSAIERMKMLLEQGKNQTEQKSESAMTHNQAHPENRCCHNPSAHICSRSSQRQTRFHHFG